MAFIALLAPSDRLVSGSMLCAEDRRHVLNAYVHRYTGTHTPDWARCLRPDGSEYPVQFADDADWLANTRFVVRKNGRLDGRYKECVSTPTWPANPELRRPVAPASLSPA